MREPRPDVAALLDQGVPRWDRIPFDVLCSRCGYNLRLLGQPRCPECGLDFEWPAVVDAAAWRSTFLFEHHWRTRPLSSWLRTVWRGLRPFSFWRRVTIHERVRAGPLRFLVALAPLVFLVVLHGGAWLGYLAVDAAIGVLGPVPPTAVGSMWTTVRRDWHELATMPLLPIEQYAHLPAAVVITVLASLALLCSLRETLGRCRVRTVQVLRVYAYSITPLLILQAAIVLTIPVVVAWMRLLFPNSMLARVIPLLAAAVCVVGIFGSYLAVGLHIYLKLPRAWLLGLTTSFVALLTAATALVAWVVATQ